MMKRFARWSAATAIAGATILTATASQCEILALVIYESKTADALKTFSKPVRGKSRIEAIGVMDVDPQSPQFGKLVREIELPPDWLAHHIFYNRDSSKAYITSLGKTELRVIDMTKESLPVKTIAVPECQVGEDVVFSDDNTRWYLTCMGSQNVVEGDALKDVPLKAIKLPKPYPHGIAIHNGIDRILATSTVRPSDLGDAGDSISVVKASTGEAVGSFRVSKKADAGREAPVEVLFVPGTNPPIAYIANLNGASLWAATWDPKKEAFEAAEAYNFGNTAAVPLEMYFNDDRTRFYVTTAKPGHLHIFDISAQPDKPRLLKSIPAAEGAHHVVFNKDMSMAWVQNSLLNLPGMSDGSITVIDLKQEKVIASINTLKDDGLTPNCIVLLPKWNNPAGH
jgi:DNA-binding beta-propeller fold protein YncE